MDHSMTDARDIPGQQASLRRQRQQQLQFFAANQNSLLQGHAFAPPVYPVYGTQLPIEASKEFQELDQLMAGTARSGSQIDDSAVDVVDASAPFEMELDGFPTNLNSFPQLSCVVGPSSLSVSTAVPVSNARGSIDQDFLLSRTNSSISCYSGPFEDTFSVTSGYGSSGGFAEDILSPMSTSADVTDQSFSPINLSANSSFMGARFSLNSIPSLDSMVSPSPSRPRAPVPSFRPAFSVAGSHSTAQRPSFTRPVMRSPAFSGLSKVQETRQPQTLGLEEFLQQWAEVADESYPEIGDLSNIRGAPSIPNPSFHSDIIGRVPTPRNLDFAGSLDMSTDPWSGTGQSGNHVMQDLAWLEDIPLSTFNINVSPPSRTPTPANHARTWNVRSSGQQYLTPPLPRRQHSQSDPPPVSPSIISPMTAPELQRSNSSTTAGSLSNATVIRRKRRMASPRLTGKLSTSLESESSKMAPATRGKRNGPLRQDAKVGAKKARNERSVCIRCKHSRQTCRRDNDDPDGVCIACQGLNDSNPWVDICTKAYFYDMVQSGTLNYISQRAINHLIPNTSQRVRIELDPVFNIDGTLAMLEKVVDRFNIRVEQGGQSVYVMDLGRCREYLLSIRQQLRAGQRDLRSFIDQDILKSKGWKSCLVGCDPMQDPLASLILWTCMPSRATYSMVPKDRPDAKGQPMDPLGADRENVKLAGQLSRMLCRKLEVEAYFHLQRVINSGLQDDGEILPFLRRLGEILVTLRWRVSWWTVLGGGQPGQGVVDADKAKFEERVNQLCRILYFYYCAFRRKLPAFSDTRALEGVYSQYADTAVRVWDAFPGRESIDGFNAWMSEGKELIDKAGVREKIRTIEVVAY